MRKHEKALLAFLHFGTTIVCKKKKYFTRFFVAGLILLFFEMSGGFQPLPTNKLQPLMDAVTTKGPVVVSIDASGWNSYGGGVFAPWLSLVWVCLGEFHWKYTFAWTGWWVSTCSNISEPGGTWWASRATDLSRFVLFRSRVELCRRMRSSWVAKF